MASVTNRFYIQDDSHQLVTGVRATLGTDVSFKQEMHYLRGQVFSTLLSMRKRARSIRPLSLLIKPNRNRKAASKLHNYTGLSLSLSLSLGFVFHLVFRSPTSLLLSLIFSAISFSFSHHPFAFRLPPLAETIPSEQDYQLARNTSTSIHSNGSQKLEDGIEYLTGKETFKMRFSTGASEIFESIFLLF